ncbi:MAG: 16S rRNA (adenine(1518)-N(6)/adenine(1519)-N(6))-dimethyltransferase RsmA [Bacillota bacterium]
MSLEETKELLQSHHITPNKLLGQNFMIEPSLYPKLSGYAALSKADVVLDVGAGLGWLTCFLAGKSKAVVAVEKDTEVAAILNEQANGLSNVTVIEGDVLKVAMPEFNKVIAAPPYYLSSQLVVWLLDQKIDCAVLILQKEFADRLVAPIGSEEYGWLTVLTKQMAEVGILDTVPKELFYPQPEVDSVIVRLKPWGIKPFEIKERLSLMNLVKWLFTQRNKKLAKAISPFIRGSLKISKQEADKMAFSLPHKDRRVRQLKPEDFGDIANALRE